MKFSPNTHKKKSKSIRKICPACFLKIYISVRACKYLQLLCLKHVSHVASFSFCVVDHTLAPIACDSLDASWECPRLSKHSFKTTHVPAGWMVSRFLNQDKPNQDLIESSMANNDPAAVINCASLAETPGCSMFGWACGPNVFSTNTRLPHNADRFISFLI